MFFFIIQPAAYVVAISAALGLLVVAFISLGLGLAHWIEFGGQ